MMDNANRFCHWFHEKKLDAPLLPDERGIFELGAHWYILPFLRAYWPAREEDDNENAIAHGGPEWEPQTWEPVSEAQSNDAEKKAPSEETAETLATKRRKRRRQHSAAQEKRKVIGYTRFLRADQLLDWLAHHHNPSQDLQQFNRQLWRLFKYDWLIPVEQYMTDRLSILQRLVEAIRVSWRSEADKKPKKRQGGQFLWSRRVLLFPTPFRENTPGLDLIHTPENAHAGLTRYLCEGYAIGVHGKLEATEKATSWGPSTSLIPHYLHDAPRRLMLASSLQAHAVPLKPEDISHAPKPVGLTGEWSPDGRKLRAVFSVLGGLTHEDGIVISESAKRKLTRHDEQQVRVPLPLVVHSWNPHIEGPVLRNELLLEAKIDLFALGYQQHEATKIGAKDGWLQVELPGSLVGQDARLTGVLPDTHASPQFRHLFRFTLERELELNVGDKLSTLHGIKGVVSKILPDNSMPRMSDKSDERAEMVLSPVGIARRGAMGQFREIDPHASKPPTSGTITVLRQPQDAEPRCRAVGPLVEEVRGQRYGEMEFCALMAHGVPAIAKELLSAERSAAPWTELQAEFVTRTELEHINYRQLAADALNHYLSIIGVQVGNGCLTGPSAEKETYVVPHNPEAFEIDVSTDARHRESVQHLDDTSWFLQEAHGNNKKPLGFIRLKDPITLSFRYQKGLKDAQVTSVVFHGIHIIPPWLRPRVQGRRHPLTRAYQDVMDSVLFNKELSGAIRTCVHLALNDEVGATMFLRREVLGRRLTRSARAVIVPRPELRIDQIAIPKRVCDIIFAGLPDKNTKLVLVNRNPTLHRRGLLALQPVVDCDIYKDNLPVIGFPLAVLKVMGADFDGDQACVVALESEEALAEAEKLRPGSEDLRRDAFRSDYPAFPLTKELGEYIDGEKELARRTDLPRIEQWCEAHREMVNRIRESVGDGWQSQTYMEGFEKNKDYWDGLDERAWLEKEQKAQEMRTVYRSVHAKGQVGGILRRQFYRRAFTDVISFWRTVDALQTVTERLVQAVLSVKHGKGQVTVKHGEREVPFPKRFFENPAEFSWALDGLNENLKDCLEVQELCAALGHEIEPKGLLAWLARAGTSRPPVEKVVCELLELAKDGQTTSSDDPRIAWYLA